MSPPNTFPVHGHAWNVFPSSAITLPFFTIINWKDIRTVFLTLHSIIHQKFPKLRLFKKGVSLIGLSIEVQIVEILTMVLNNEDNMRHILKVMYFHISYFVDILIHSICVFRKNSIRIKFRGYFQGFGSFFFSVFSQGNSYIRM